MKFLSVLLLCLAGCEPEDPTKPCTGAGCAIVTTSQYNADFTGSGTLYTLSKSGNISPPIDTTLDPDTFLFLDDGANGDLLIVNRGLGNVRVYNPKDFTLKAEIPTGNSAAPAATSQAKEVWAKAGSNRLFVSMQGNKSANAVGILDKTQASAGVVKWIDIPTVAADSDGKPEAASLFECDGLLYVTMQNFTVMGFDVTYAAGSIAIIDPSSETLVGNFNLVSKNPSNMIRVDDCDNVLVATAGNLTSVPDGTTGLERLNLSSKTSSGLVISDSQLSGRPYALTRASTSLAFAALYFDPQPNSQGNIILSSTKVVAINPTSGALIGDVTDKAGNVPFVSLSTSGALFVGIGSFSGKTEPGKLAIGIYSGPADGSKLTGAPITFPQTPAAIAFQ